MKSTRRTKLFFSTEGPRESLDLSWGSFSEISSSTSQDIVFDIICERCQKIFQEQVLPSTSKDLLIDYTSSPGQSVMRFRHHSLLGLFDSADFGCHMCCLLLGCWDRSRISHLQEHLGFGPEEIDQPLILRLRISDGDGDAWNAYLDHNIPHVKGRFKPALGHLDLRQDEHILGASSQQVGSASFISRPTSFGTASVETVEQIQRWIEECLTSHPDCHHEHDIGMLPTRLLDLGHPGTQQPLRLRNAAGIQDKDVCRYATLSHCWGSTPTTILSKDKLATFYEEIPLGSLSRTFLDALDVTRNLGLRYLWIDSLCIIQDFRPDWELESPRMCEIYTNALINITATDSADSSGGLYRSRHPLAVAPCVVETQWAITYPRRIICNKDVQWEHQVTESPVYERSWVLQERLLAPRNVNFASNQVFWECRSLTASEYFPYGVPHLKGEQNLKCWDLPLKDLLDQGWHSKLHVWSFIVERYTESKLTFQSDKLVGLSGIARKMHKDLAQLPTDYLAGIWRFDLARQLPWQLRSTRPEQRSHPYRAPSWSWASVDGGVVWQGQDRDTYPKENRLMVLEAKTFPKNDPFGDVLEGGYLKLRGLVREVFPRFKVPDREQWWATAENYPQLEMPGIDPGSTWVAWDDNSPQFLVTIAAKPVYFLLVRTWERAEEDTSVSLCDGEGILLKLTGRKRGQYERIGYLIAWNMGAGEELYRRWHEIRLAPECYVAVSDMTEYTIEIV